VGLSTVFVLLSFVVPRIAEMFREAGRSLPLPTLILIKTSHFFALFWWVMILGSAVLILLAYLVVRTQRGQLLFDRLQLRIPLYGDLAIKFELSRFCRVLGTLLNNGISLLKALNVTGATLENKLLAGELQRIAEGVRQGEPMSRQMASRNHCFP